MLYDILIIDDDFIKYLPDTASDRKTSSEDNAVTFSSEDEADLENGMDLEEDFIPNAMSLLLEFIEDNLRVTFTAGREDDWSKFNQKDLSEIKFIVLDLYLAGIDGDDYYVNVNSNLLGIIEKVDEYLNEDKVIIYINSSFKNPKYKKEGLPALIENIDEEYGDKFEVIVCKRKNVLSTDDRKKLMKNNILHYQRNLVIIKAIEIEEEIEKKIKSYYNYKDAKDFHEKMMLLKKISGMSRSHNIFKEINLLKEIRNNLAHNKDLYGKLSSDFMKALKEIVGEEIEKTGNFKSFDQLVKYIDSLDKLKKDIRALTKDASDK